MRDLENPSLKGLLRRVIGKIFNDTEIKGWCKEFEEKNLANGIAAANEAPRANGELAPCFDAILG